MVVARAAVNEADADAPLGGVGVEVVEDDRLEESGHAGRGGDGVAEPDRRIVRRRVRVVEAAQAVVTVYLRAERRGRLAHVGGRELPGVPGVERGGVEDEDGGLVLAPPVVAARVEVGLPERAAVRARADLRVDVEVSEQALLALEAEDGREPIGQPARACDGATPVLAVLDLGVKLALVEFAHAQRARVARRENHLEVGRQLGEHARPYVALHASEEVLFEAADDLDVVPARDLFVGLRL